MKSKVRLSIFLFLCLLIAGIFHATSGSSAQNNYTVYLPVVTKPIGPVDTVVGGLGITIDSPFMPGEMVASNSGDASQVASAFLVNQYEEFSVVAVPYGTFATMENLPVAQQGGANAYRTALQTFRNQQGGNPMSSIAISLFGQNVVGSYSAVNIITGNDAPKQTLILEWVAEANNHIWIIRIAKDLSDGTNAINFMNSLQGLTIVQNASTNQQQQLQDITSINQVMGSIPVPSWWSGNCNVNNHPESYQLAEYDGLVACGPVRTAKLVYFYTGAVGQYEWQCTELAKRYLYLKYGVEPYLGNGKDVVNNMPVQYIGTFFERIPNGTPQKAPQAGDVISFATTWTAGHVVVVTGSNVDSNGNGNITIIEQNLSQSGQRTIPVKNWRVGGNAPAINWLHEIDQTPPPTPTPTPTPVPGTGTTIRVSIASDGSEGNNFSGYPTTSDDGRYIAFASGASNLVVGDTNMVSDIFVHDLQTGQTTRVSLTSDGTQANGDSRHPYISSNGMYIAFVSEATNLYPGITDGVYLHNIQTGETSLISVSTDNTPGNGGYNNPRISENGQYVVFDSSSNNLVPNDINGRHDIFSHNLISGETSIISIASNGEYGNNESIYPYISSDGRFITFISSADNLVQNDSNNNRDVFVRDTLLGETIRVSTSSNGVEADRDSEVSAISSSGQLVVFSSTAGNLVPEYQGGFSQIYLHDLQSSITTLVSKNSSGIPANFHSRNGQITDNGQTIFFHSNATNLVLNDENEYGDDIFMRNLQTETTNIMLLGQGHSQPNDWISLFSITPNSYNITFDSGASNLVPNDNNNIGDVFVHIIGE